jgi:hypothetical protein
VLPPTPPHCAPKSAPCAPSSTSCASATRRTPTPINARWGGAGGHQWIELRFLQDYIDGDKQGYTQYGIWAHGKSGSDQPAEQSTSGPSS